MHSTKRVVKMECIMCHTYVHDALRNPVYLPGTNGTRAAKYAHLFVPEFVRAAHMNTDGEFVSLLFVEVGGVKRSCHIRDPMAVARIWVRHQQQAIGNLSEIHNGHVKPPPALRIRIPRTREYDDLYT